MRTHSLLLVVLVFALPATSGSAADKPSVVATLDGYVPREPSARLAIVDARPGTDKVSDNGSLWVTRCRYGIIQFGDDAMIPDKLTLLRRDIEDDLGSAGPAITLTVNRYLLVVNRSGPLRRSLNNISPPGQRMVGAVLTPNDCTDFSYDWVEMDRPGVPFIVVIDVTMNGQNMHVRTAYAPRSDSVGVTMFEAMRRAHAILLRRMRLALGLPVGAPLEGFNSTLSSVQPPEPAQTPVSSPEAPNDNGTSDAKASSGVPTDAAGNTTNRRPARRRWQ